MSNAHLLAHVSAWDTEAHSSSTIRKSVFNLSLSLVVSLLYSIQRNETQKSEAPESRSMSIVFVYSIIWAHSSTCRLSFQNISGRHVQSPNPCFDSTIPPLVKCLLNIPTKRPISCSPLAYPSRSCRNPLQFFERLPVAAKAPFRSFLIYQSVNVGGPLHLSSSLLFLFLMS